MHDRPITFNVVSDQRVNFAQRHVPSAGQAGAAAGRQTPQGRDAWTELHAGEHASCAVQTLSRR